MSSEVAQQELADEAQGLEVQAQEQAQVESGKQANGTNLTDEEYMLAMFRAHMDNANKLLQLVSSNGLRRVVKAYVRAGVYDIPKFQDKAEERLFNELMGLHDVKYSLLVGAIDKASKEAEAKASLEENKEEIKDNG